MAAKHGTRHRYNEGCRVLSAKGADAAYRRDRQRRACVVDDYTSDAHFPVDLQEMEPGPVESGVAAELAGLAEDRPGLAQVALALARIMDNPKAVSSHPAAAKVLATLLDKQLQAPIPARRGHLAAVRRLAEKGGA